MWIEHSKHSSSFTRSMRFIRNQPHSKQCNEYAWWLMRTRFPQCSIFNSLLKKKQSKHKRITIFAAYSSQWSWNELIMWFNRLERKTHSEQINNKNPKKVMSKMMSDEDTEISPVELLIFRVNKKICQRYSAWEILFVLVSCAHQFWYRHSY